MINIQQQKAGILCSSSVIFFQKTIKTDEAYELCEVYYYLPSSAPLPPFFLYILKVVNDLLVCIWACIYRWLYLITKGNHPI